MRKRHWFWGVYLLLIAVFLLYSRSNDFVNISVFSWLGAFFCAAFIVHSLARKNFPGVIIPLALLYWIFEKPLEPYGFPQIEFWVLILAGVLGTIGLTLILPKGLPYRKYRSDKYKEYAAGSHFVYDGRKACTGYAADPDRPSGENDDHPQISVKFGAISRYLRSQKLQSVHLGCHFGELQVYFDQAMPVPGGAALFVSASFGAVKLFVPASWRIVNECNTFLGAVEMSEHRSWNSNAPTLTLNGHCSFGAVEVVFI